MRGTILMIVNKPEKDPVKLRSRQGDLQQSQSWNHKGKNISFNTGGYVHRILRRITTNFESCSLSVSFKSGSRSSSKTVFGTRSDVAYLQSQQLCIDGLGCNRPNGSRGCRLREHKDKEGRECGGVGWWWERRWKLLQYYYCISIWPVPLLL